MSHAGWLHVLLIIPAKSSLNSFEEMFAWPRSHRPRAVNQLSPSVCNYQYARNKCNIDYHMLAWDSSLIKTNINHLLVHRKILLAVIKSIQSAHLIKENPSQSLCVTIKLHLNKGLVFTRQFRHQESWIKNIHMTFWITCPWKRNMIFQFSFASFLALVLLYGFINHLDDESERINAIVFLVETIA